MCLQLQLLYHHSHQHQWCHQVLTLYQAHLAHMCLQLQVSGVSTTSTSEFIQIESSSQMFQSNKVSSSTSPVSSSTYIVPSSSSSYVPPVTTSVPPQSSTPVVSSSTYIVPSSSSSYVPPVTTSVHHSHQHLLHHLVLTLYQVHLAHMFLQLQVLLCLLHQLVNLFK